MGEFLNPDYFDLGFYTFWEREIKADRKRLFTVDLDQVMERYLDHVRASRPEKVILFDLKIEYLAAMPAAVSSIYRREYKFIQLTRLNVLKQVVSEHIMYETSKNGGAQFDIDPGWVLARMRRKHDEAIRFNGLLKATLWNGDVFRTTYEELTDSKRSANRLRDLTKFIGLDDFELTSIFAKQNVLPLSEVVRNWGDVRDMVASSEFAYTLYLPE
jgi:hypothetical protein